MCHLESTFIHAHDRGDEVFEHKRSSATASTNLKSGWRGTTHAVADVYNLEDVSAIVPCHLKPEEDEYHSEFLHGGVFDKGVLKDEVASEGADVDGLITISNLGSGKPLGSNST